MAKIQYGVKRTSLNMPVFFGENVAGRRPKAGDVFTKIRPMPVWEVQGVQGGLGGV